MARQKRIPNKPDAFQRRGRVMASWVLDRSTIIVGVLSLFLVAIIVGAFVSSASSEVDREAWNAYYKAAGDTEKTRAALKEHDSGSVTPYLLLMLARSEASPPRDDEGKPKEESGEDRTARLKRVQDTLTKLTTEYVDHYLYLNSLVFLGQIQEERGEYLEAIETFRKALKADPRELEPKIKYDIGRNYFLAGDLEKAREPLERSVELTSKMLRGPFGYRGQMDEVMPLWRENAEYLLARVGPSERTISVDEKKPEEPEQPEQPEETEEPKETEETETDPADAAEKVPSAPESELKTTDEPAANTAQPTDAESTDAEAADAATTEAPADDGVED